MTSHLTVVLLASTQIFHSWIPPRLLLQTFLVRRDGSLKHLVLCVHFPSPKESSPKVLQYAIKEEKSSKCSSSRSGLRPHSSSADATPPNHRHACQAGGV